MKTINLHKFLGRIIFIKKQIKMPTEITINSLTGTPDYNIYICDDPITTCVWIDQISVTPYQFTIPSILDGQSSYNLKIVDDNGCEIISNLNI